MFVANATFYVLKGAGPALRFAARLPGFFFVLVHLRLQVKMPPNEQRTVKCALYQLNARRNGR